MVAHPNSVRFLRTGEAVHREPEPMLQIERLTVSFGGLQALDNVSLSVLPGQVLGLIGPNGAGKTTLFNVVCGFLRPAAGEVWWRGRPLRRHHPRQLTRLGIARTLQSLGLFGHLTVAENVMVGALTRTHDVKHAREQAQEWLRRVGLLEKANAHARTLSTGQRKRLELARALATEPRLVLLDEVTGGVDQRSIPGLVELVRELHAGGLTLLVIEHNMRVVTAMAQRIIALHMGELIADGAPDAVARERRVVEAYLGQAYVA
jgi:branched-chain amino acid transport system ATP-binding protein